MNAVWIVLFGVNKLTLTAPYRQDFQIKVIGGIHRCHNDLYCSIKREAWRRDVGVTVHPKFWRYPICLDVGADELIEFSILNFWKCSCFSCIKWARWSAGICSHLSTYSAYWKASSQLKQDFNARKTSLCLFFSTLNRSSITNPTLLSNLLGFWNACFLAHWWNKWEITDLSSTANLQKGTGEVIKGYF